MRSQQTKGNATVTLRRGEWGALCAGGAAPLEELSGYQDSQLNDTAHLPRRVVKKPDSATQFAPQGSQAGTPTPAGFRTDFGGSAQAITVL